MSRYAPSRQSGSATVVLTWILSLAMLLMAAFAHRHLVTDVQLSAVHYRGIQAFEAAEAGLEWTLAGLNSGTRLDASCSASDSPEAQPFSEHALGPPDEEGRRLPRKAGNAPLQSGCVQQAGHWACTCPSIAAPVPVPAEGVHFTSWLLPGERPGMLHMVSAGCSGGTVPCHAGPTNDGATGPATQPQADAGARLRVVLARLPALSTEPAAALNVQGSLALGAHPWVVRHEGGITVHTGGDILASALDLGGHGAGQASSWPHDAELAGLPPEALFASLFRLTKADWPQQPTVRRVDCSTACDTRLLDALGSGITHPLVWLQGGLRLDRPTVIGTPERPVLLVSDGPVQLDAAVHIHGLVYGTAPAWRVAAGARIQGAVVQEGSLQGTGTLHIDYDTAVLKRLRTQYGIWARVAGSWRDF